MRVKLIEDLPMATSAELYQLSWVIEQLMADPRRIVQARRRLMEAATALAEHGTPPPGTLPEQQRVRSVAIVLPEDQPFHEAARDALRAEPGKPHSSV